MKSTYALLDQPDFEDLLRDSSEEDNILATHIDAETMSEIVADAILQAGWNRWDTTINIVINGKDSTIEYTYE
jgi:hypothetical protein